MAKVMANRRSRTSGTWPNLVTMAVVGHNRRASLQRQKKPRAKAAERPQANGLVFGSHISGTLRPTQPTVRSTPQLVCVSGQKMKHNLSFMIYCVYRCGWRTAFCVGSPVCVKPEHSVSSFKAASGMGKKLSNLRAQ